MAKRVIMRIELTPEAKDRLATISENRGMTQVSVTSRLVEWFAHQNEMVQGVILGHYPKELFPDIVPVILKAMAENSGARKKKTKRSGLEL
ncbi:MAG: hypothetical protein IT443_04350 [Phycisphaeraceae bacterium]|nr:hypothetical protein [Phycisphaeraceae bacterium]